MTDITNLPDFPPPDRLMSSVMSLAQEAVDRVETLRAALRHIVVLIDRAAPLEAMSATLNALEETNVE